MYKVQLHGSYSRHKLRYSINYTLPCQWISVDNWVVSIPIFIYALVYSKNYSTYYYYFRNQNYLISKINNFIYKHKSHNVFYGVRNIIHPY